MPQPARWGLLLLLLGACARGARAELTIAEAAECHSHPELIAFELHGGVLLELLVFMYCIIMLYVLIEERYVPALEMMASSLGIPPPLVGSTLMAAGNCLPELSISLVALLLNGQDIGTGEVLGSCVFDMLAILGVVCLKTPPEGLRLSPHLMFYFLFWVLAGVAVDFCLFYAATDYIWYLAMAMVGGYTLYTLGIFALNRYIDVSGDFIEIDSPTADAPTAAPPAPIAPGAPPKESHPLLSDKSPGAEPSADGVCAVWCCCATRGERTRCGAIMDALYAPPRFLYRWTVPEPDRRACGDRRLWPATVVTAIVYTLVLSFTMVEIASRSICLLGIRKNSLGATVLCFAAGFPDLITAIVLCHRPGMQQMAASNSFGAFIFNAFIALGLPWVVLGFSSDIYPPARSTLFVAIVGFLCTLVAVVAVLVCRLRLNRNLGAFLLLLYAFYLTTVIHDGLTRLARPPE